ncbi:hypothetical protein HO173_005284 [Letharia columbiana]|uniref:Uncharacterized protein n=1 Tax=Letharia columbiana TaxID=112416 RepID=A0A8H6FX86_9LECA|nr:uncharacterized protein HO173_005284 [Letharia columbiana]KAF6236503.1 hypothetical protein HO173_005284 [Letharia columbiana]
MMPTLKQLTCNVEWAGSRLPLQEYHTIYADGYVETFIAVPSTPTPFSIHLRSHGYIAPGLAVFVYMDGVYQCNRNRRNLEIPNENTSRKKFEVDFIVRQKEELLWDGTFEGKQWGFEKVKIVPDSSVEDGERPPHDGEYVGTIEVVVLRCHPSDKRRIIGNKAFPDESSDGNEPSTPGRFDGASDPQLESKSKSGCKAQTFGPDGGWDDWGPPPPPLDEPKMGRIEMTSENTGTWNPVGQGSNSSNALEKTKRWDKRSESRDHFQSDFQKSESPAGSRRGRSVQPRSITDQENAPPLNLRGGGPGSYSIASSEAMRNWNGGPPALKEWTQGDAPSKGHGGLPAAFDPWTANLPTGDFTDDAETKPQTHVEAWGTVDETKNKPGSKKGSKKDSIVSRNPNNVPGAWGESNDQDQGRNDDWGGNDDPNQGNNGDNWGASGDTGNSGDDWGGAGNPNAQKNDEWNAGGDQSQEKNDGWNNNGGASSWDAPKKDGKRDDGAWNPPNDKSNGNNDDWAGNQNIDLKQRNDEWRATEDNGTKQNDDWGATTGNNGQQGNSWGGDAGRQSDTWGGEDTMQVTTGAKDPETEDKSTSNQPAASGEKAGSALSFGNSRAKGSKPASIKPKTASVTSNKKPLPFDWLQPLEKASSISGPTVAVKKASVPGAWASPVASRNQGEPKPVVAQVPPTFSISTPPKPKPYWSKWRNLNIIAEAEMEEEHALSPEELKGPVYSIPAEVAQRNMMSHQVRPGRPAAYTHKRNKPRYMDTHESPYAVFLFKYRDKEIVEHMLKTTITEPEVDEKARLASLSKQDLIDELMKTKSKLSVVESDSSGQATFVKKLDEKLSKLETSKEDVPAIDDWVNTTSPTNGQGNGNAGEWGKNDTQKGNGKGGSGNGNETSNTNGGDWSRNENSNNNTNGNGGESWGGNGDSNANGKSDWNNNGNAEVSNGAEESGNGGNDWGITHQTNGGEKKDDNGWGGNDNGGGGDWNNNNNNSGGRTKSADNRGDDNGDTKAADDWGNDNEGGNDKGGDRWGNNGGEGYEGWGGGDDKKDEGKGNGDCNAGGDNSWGADAGGGGGGGW